MNELKQLKLKVLKEKFSQETNFGLEKKSYGNFLEETRSSTFSKKILSEEELIKFSELLSEESFCDLLTLDIEEKQYSIDFKSEEKRWAFYNTDSTAIIKDKETGRLYYIDNEEEAQKYCIDSFGSDKCISQFQIITDPNRQYVVDFDVLEGLQENEIDSINNHIKNLILEKYESLVIEEDKGVDYFISSNATVFGEDRIVKSKLVNKLLNNEMDNVFLLDNDTFELLSTDNVNTPGKIKESLSKNNSIFVFEDTKTKDTIIYDFHDNSFSRSSSIIPFVQTMKDSVLMLVEDLRIFNSHNLSNVKYDFSREEEGIIYLPITKTTFILQSDGFYEIENEKEERQFKEMFLKGNSEEYFNFLEITLPYLKEKDKIENKLKQEVKNDLDNKDKPKVKRFLMK